MSEDWNEPIGQTLNGLLTKCDDWIALAADEKTRPQVEVEAVVFWQLLNRFQLICSNISRKHPYKVVA
jgi:hypothetical protein